MERLEAGSAEEEERCTPPETEPQGPDSELEPGDETQSAWMQPEEAVGRLQTGSRLTGLLDPFNQTEVKDLPPADKKGLQQFCLSKRRPDSGLLNPQRWGPSFPVVWFEQKAMCSLRFSGEGVA